MVPLQIKKIKQQHQIKVSKFKGKEIMTYLASSTSPSTATADHHDDNNATIDTVSGIATLPKLYDGKDCIRIMALSTISKDYLTLNDF